MKYQFIITSHSNISLSGVAKFNHILANRLGIRSLSIRDVDTLEQKPVLLSVKLGDADPFEIAKFTSLLNTMLGLKLEYDLFFHTYDGLEIEEMLVKGARSVFLAHQELSRSLTWASDKCRVAWCPGLINPTAVITESNLNVFSFGMAHKIQVQHYRKLNSLLANHNITYSIWVSTAFHEKSRFGDFDSINQEMHEIFGDRIQVLGFLSDDAVNYFLDKADLFVSFFAKGIRTNNTSAMAAMNRGKAVLTNFDCDSPSWLKHGENFLDVSLTEERDLTKTQLALIGQNAKSSYDLNASWECLDRFFLDNLSQKDSATSSSSGRDQEPGKIVANY